MADAVAKTSTPDGAAGNPIDITTVTTGAGTVDRQRVSIADSTTATDAPVTANGLKVDVAFPATQPVSITGTIPVSGPLTDTQLRATPVPVSGTVIVVDSVDLNVHVQNFPATQPVSATALPLPTGAALEAGHLATIDTSTAKIPPQGQALAAASMPVVLTAIQQTALTPPAAITGFALEAGHIATIDSHTPALGQALAAASVPVVLTAAQVTTLTPPAAITGFALEAGHLATIDTSTAKIPSQGQALAAASLPVVLTAAQIITLTPPAAITGFTLEAGHIATIDSHIPALGQALAAASVPVVLTAIQIAALTPVANATVNVAQVAGTTAVNPSVQAGAWFTQRRSFNTYTAVFRLAARPHALSNAFAAAGRKQYATIHHAAIAVKTVKLKRVEIALESSSAAAIIGAELVRITTAPVTGNPAITPSPTNPGNAVAEATCLALPTTAATEGALHANLEWNLGITATGSVVNPPPGLNWYTLWPQTQGASEADENQFPTIRAGVLEGFAITLDSSAISVVKGYVVIEFTEE